MIALLRAGVDRLVIEYITEHSNGGVGSSEVTRTYIHGPRIRQMQEAVKRLEWFVAVGGCLSDTKSLR